ncbi:MAG TPA: serine--tRNA ligase [Solirubrobacteraceae bacterium]|jgi:seryl-tRNA synthetase|nr:serine--tRNA ligase [Solirubrobacteraceae bacterium]
MLDLRLIREDGDGVRAALARRGPDAVQALEQVLALDERWRAANTSAESLRAEQKAHSENVAAGKRAGRDVSDELAELKDTSAEVKALTEQARLAQERLQGVLATLPNLPEGDAADEDTELRTVGTPRELGFAPRDHLELAGARVDMRAGARLSGSRFAYLRGELVLLELALVRWVLDRLMAEGFEPVVPPVLVRERALYGTGFLPDTEQQIYALPADELFLVGTSEVALASLHDGEILAAEQLPLRYAGFSSCFRREAGAAGRDTRGIFRVHQFDKVEMFCFVEPDRSREEHERLLAIEEGILAALELPYRVVNIAVGDLGNSAAKKYDCEAWLPSQRRYRELTSCSNTTDYQARRLDIRMRREKRTATPHTLNGTAVAVGRTIIALLENGQLQDGSVQLPACLHDYGVGPVLASAVSPT